MHGSVLYQVVVVTFREHIRSPSWCANVSAALAARPPPSESTLLSGHGVFAMKKGWGKSWCSVGQWDSKPGPAALPRRARNCRPGIASPRAHADTRAHEHAHAHVHAHVLVACARTCAGACAGACAWHCARARPPTHAHAPAPERIHTRACTTVGVRMDQTRVCIRHAKQLTHKGVPATERLWPSCGPAVAQRWPNCGPAVAKLWAI